MKKINSICFSLIKWMLYVMGIFHRGLEEFLGIFLDLDKYILVVRVQYFI